jgi:predicted ATPase
MKIKYLEIKNYKQFKDLTLDFTYPQGHEKAGEPLDKICIIGQSGTGKTNLLEIIKKSVINFSKLPTNSYIPFSEFSNDINLDSYITNKFIAHNNLLCETLFTKITSTIASKQDIEALENEKVYFVGATKMPIIVNNDIIKKTMPETEKNLLDGLIKHKEEIIKKGINIYSSNGIDEFEQELRIVDEKISAIEEKYAILQQFKSENYIDRNIININENTNTWSVLKEKIDNYEEEKNNYTKQLFNKLLNEADYSKEASIQDMTIWEEKNENILAKIADDINSIIKKFNLELQMNEYTKSYDELIIQDLSNNQTIKYDDLSTGTKNLLSTFIPLKTYAPKDSIILIDEPEMSFYPDIQRQLTDLYMNVGSNNQLVLATHSPLIASSFEPWEVVELKFNQHNQVYREKYYEGENHIDNYTLNPQLLTWTGILTDIFDLKEDSNFTFRENKLMEYASLKAEIKMIENPEEKEEKFKELMKLSKLLGLAN